ncbi:hypothetical protein CVU37_11410 [candidate division BRC1 bacterium HGW-BRC1-1]|nr:MAG: hypothetical protein CVU37_11410 [candidate division BRC1 bacterium HGW-BRC1-1]
MDVECCKAVSRGMNVFRVMPVLRELYPMKNGSRRRGMLAGKAFMVVLTAAAMIFTAATVHAEEFKLPDAQEVSTFSPDAMQFYMAGVNALDRIDHLNGYINLSKAAQLEPDALRLNLITAAVALKMGRKKPAAEAQPYYDTAIVSYGNVLRHAEMSDSFIRDVQNRLRIAMEEQGQLVQRDNKREALGSAFVMALNKEIATVEETPAPAEGAPGAAAPTPALTPMIGVNPYATPVIQPGMGQPGMIPGMGQPGMIPGMDQPGMPGPGQGAPLI